MIQNEETLIKLDELITRLNRLPPLPESIQRINKMIDNKQATLETVGLEVAKDQAISAQVLQLVNSSFYGFSQTVSSIKHAVVLLGLNAIRTLVSSSWASDMMAGYSKGFHHHSMATARACYIISRSLGIGEPEEVSALGLLHDMGKAVMARHLPEEFEQVCDYTRTHRVGFYVAEQAVIGVDHSTLGAALLEKWNLPASAVIPIEYHHHADLPADYRDETAVLKLANLIVRAEGYGCAGDDVMLDFSEELMDQLEIRLGDLLPLSNEVCDQMRSIPRYIGAESI